MKNALIIVGIGALILAGGWWYLARMNTETARNSWQPPTSEPRTEGPYGPPPSAVLEHGAGIGKENTVEFACADGKTITAVFARDIVGLTLSDGRQITLREAASASLAGQAGIRYLNSTQTIEFRGEGNTASVIENGTTTYTHCIATY
ncbi:MAG: MliC family protein [Patescibacteria group bacterium]